MNLLMKKLGPNITLPLMVTVWGMVTACQGAVKSYGGLLACRFFLGALEGGQVAFMWALSRIVLMLRVDYSPASRSTCHLSTGGTTCNCASL